jgi:chromosome segregation ATPase
VQSGKKVLKELNKTLKQARKHLDDMDHELETSAQALALNTRAQARTLRRLAEIRLEAMGQGELEMALDAADKEARDCLASRERAIASLETQITQAQAALDELEHERDANHDAVEAAALEVTEREAAAQARLETDADYTAQLMAVRELDAQADACKVKTAQAKTDERDKGESYRTDPLFNYLWERKYGTSDYRANLLARMLDGWVARLCRYEQARKNYWMLQELPGRLEEHAKALREEADEALIALWKLEKSIADEIGVEAAQKTLKLAEAAQDGVDDRIVAAEEKLRALLDERGQFAAGEDKYIKGSLTAMAQMMDTEEIDDLLAMAVKTRTSEDDELVRQLDDLRDEELVLRDELGEHRELHASYAGRLNDLEDVRRRFKSSRYDDLRSGFSNDVLIGNMIGGILGGAIAGGALWKGLQRQQRFRDVGNAWPDFGSGGLMKKRKQAGNWHWPQGRDDEVEGFKLPRSSRSHRKYRTGGGD